MRDDQKCPECDTGVITEMGSSDAPLICSFCGALYDRETGEGLTSWIDTTVDPDNVVEAR